MAGPGGMTEEQLKIEERFNEILRERIRLQGQANSMAGDAANVSQQMKEAASENVKTQAEVKDQIAQVTEAMRNQTDGSSGLAAALGRSSSAFGGATQAQTDNLEVAEKWATAFAAANVVYTGLMDNIKGTMMIFSTMGDLARGGFGIMQSAIGVLVAPFQGLMQMGAEYNLSLIHI